MIWPRLHNENMIRNGATNGGHPAMKHSWVQLNTAFRCYQQEQLLLHSRVNFTVSIKDGHIIGWNDWRESIEASVAVSVRARQAV